MLQEFFIAFLEVLPLQGNYLADSWNIVILIEEPAQCFSSSEVFSPKRSVWTSMPGSVPAAVTSSFISKESTTISACSLSLCSLSKEARLSYPATTANRFSMRQEGLSEHRLRRKAGNAPIAADVWSRISSSVPAAEREFLPYRNPCFRMMR